MGTFATNRCKNCIVGIKDALKIVSFSFFISYFVWLHSWMKCDNQTFAFAPFYYQSLTMTLNITRLGVKFNARLWFAVFNIEESLYKSLSFESLRFNKTANSS